MINHNQATAVFDVVLIALTSTDVRDLMHAEMYIMMATRMKPIEECVHFNSLFRILQISALL